MKRVVISYDSHNDTQIAERIEKDLGSQDIGIWIDKKGIKPATVLLKDIDDALYHYDYVLGIVTDTYLKSTGGIEAYVTIKKGLDDKNMKFIPLFFISPIKVESAFISGISGFDFSEDYYNGLLGLLSFLKSEEPEKATETLSKVEGQESRSPFRRVRAELFKDNYELIGRAFAEPEKEKYELIRGNAPIFIFGGRGSGKTMILKSLTPMVVLSRLGVKTFKEAKKKGIDFFGLYFRLKKGALHLYDYNTIVEMGFRVTGQEKDYDLYRKLLDKLKNSKFDQIQEEPILSSGVNAAWTVSLNELNYKILKASIEELKKLKEMDASVLSINKAQEHELVKKIKLSLNISEESKIENFDDLLEFVNSELQKIEEYLQRLTIPSDEKASLSCHLTGIEFLDKIFAQINSIIEDLNGVTFTLLFDEFENLRFYQQIIINEWVKTAKNFVVKVSSKFEGMYTNMTFQGQALQFGQDCPRWDLDYDLFDDKSKKLYQNLLTKICANLLKIENYNETDIRNLLDEMSEPEIPLNVIDEEIKKIRESGKLDYVPNKLEDYRNKLQIAAIFRLLRKKEKVEGRASRKKAYAGFDVYTYLSSGIIRIFLNLVGMAFYKAEEEGVDVKIGQKISLEQQSWAARVVSKAWLERIPSNMDHGDKIYQFIVDIGDIFRERLLFNPSEPETLTISLLDSINLKKPANLLLNYLLCYGTKESIFIKREKSSSYFPKQTSSVHPTEYVLNRVYAPILDLSYRSRWGRCEFMTHELSGLLDENSRKNIKKKLHQRQHISAEELKTSSSLFRFTEGDDERQN
jgi:hypothetical protein